MGVNSVHLIDVPQQQGYFAEAEKHFGLLDKFGRYQPALDAYRRLGAAQE